jgi:cytidylate kinase
MWNALVKFVFGTSNSKLIEEKFKEISYTKYEQTKALQRPDVIKNKVDTENLSEVKDLLDNIKLDIVKDKFYLNNEDVSEAIRGVEVTNNVSRVAAIKVVRENLVDMQRTISEGKRVILDGRDIGTVVFPNADLKVFLVASSEERANRRVKEFLSKGIDTDFQTVLAEIIKRDEMDSTRKESPLIQAEDAVLIDTSFMTIEEVSREIINLVNKRI